MKVFWLLTIIPRLCDDTQSSHTHTHRNTLRMLHFTTEVHRTQHTLQREKHRKPLGITQCDVLDTDSQMRGLAFAGPILSNRPAVTIHSSFPAVFDRISPDLQT
jgi:hypothetical protein